MLISLLLSRRNRQAEPVKPSDVPHMRLAHLTLVAILLGLAWGAIGQALRDLQLVGDWLLMSLSLLVLLSLFLGGVYKLRSGLVRMPVKAGILAALFLVSAVTSHYGYYITTLALGWGYQGASLDMGRWGTYRVLWQLFKTSISQWLLLAAVGGFGLGWLLGWLLPALGRVSVTGRTLRGRS